MTRDEMISAVRSHAHAHYEFDGWDYVVEAMCDDQIDKYMGDATTGEEAIANVAKIVKRWDDRRTDIRG